MRETTRHREAYAAYAFGMSPTKRTISPSTP